MASLGNLYFNIKYNSDPKELEELKKKILAQFADLEVRFGISPVFSEENLMKSINKVLNEKFKLNLTVSKEEVSEAINNAVKESKPAETNVSNQAEAYKELEGAINSIIGTRGQNIKRLTDEKTALSAVQSQLKLLEKQQQSGVTLNKDQLKTKASLINRELEHKQAIAELNQLLKSDVKMTQSASSSMDEMSLRLGRMKTAYRGLSEEMRNSSFGTELKKQINIADKELKNLDASIGNHQRNVGNYASGWNGLNNSIQQVARELPSLAYGPQVFFSAISNNLPILSDELKKARFEYDALKASGQKAIPVWKQVVTSLFSWQTALVAGITLLTLYGGKIIDWIFNTEKATKVHDNFIKSLKDGNNEYMEAYKELTRLESVFKNIDGVFITQKNAIDEYNNSIGKTIGHTDSLSVAQQNIIDKKQAYLDVIIQEALANEHLAEATKLASKEQGLRMKETFKWYEKLWTVLNLKPGAETKQFMDWVSWGGWDQAMAYKNAEKADKLNAKQLKQRENFLKVAEKANKMAAAAEIDLLPDSSTDKNDPLRERISLLKEAYNTYRDISSLSGHKTALNVVHETILPGFDPATYRNEIEKIFYSKSTDATLRTEAARVLIDLDKDVLSNELKETETYIQKTIASWELFKYLFDKSGDFSSSSQAAFGESVAYKSMLDQLADNIRHEIKKSDKRISIDELILMPEDDIKNTFGSKMAAFVNAYKDQSKKLSDESLMRAADLLNTYKDYEDKRKDIISKGEKDTADLIKAGASAEAIEMVNKATSKALGKLQEDVLKDYGLSDYATEGNVSDLFKNRIREFLPLFKNVASATLSELKKAKEAIGSMKIPPQLLIDFKKAGGDAENLANIIAEAQDNAEEALDEKILNKTIDSIGKLANSIGKLGSSLQKIKGLQGVGDFFQSVSGGMGDILEFARLGKNATGMDVISLGISGVATVVDTATTAIKQNIEAQKEWSAAVENSIQKMRMYNIEQLAYKENSIFGMDNPIAPAISAINQYEKAVESMVDIEKKLGGGRVQTGTKKVPSGSAVGGFVAGGAGIGAAVGSIVPIIGTAIGAVAGGLLGGLVSGIGSLFGSKATTKTVPVFESLKDHYGELFDSETYKLNPKILADYGKMDDETKKIIDNWEEIRDKMVEADQQIEETLKNIAGTIGDDLYNALINAFSNNDLKSALNEFESSVNKILSDLAAKAMFNAIFSETLKNGEERMKRSLNPEGDQNLIDDIDWLGDELEKGMPVFLKGLDGLKDMLKGFDRELELGGTSKDGLSAGIKGVTEDTAGILSSYINSMREDGAKTTEAVLRYVNYLAPEMSAITNAQLTALRMIASNTARTADNTGKGSDITQDIYDLLSSVASGNKRLSVK